MSIGVRGGGVLRGVIRRIFALASQAVVGQRQKRHEDAAGEEVREFHISLL
jgi:hypothetical protein